jgi:deazaflavin-dependent oxidoreductase (nitroreductase family)
MDPFDGWDTHPFCYLTTTGRRSGRPHRIEIWFVVHDGAAWLLTERAPETDWARNLRADPAVTLEIGGWQGPATATAEDDLAPDAPVRAALAARYQASYGPEDLRPWARTALAVRVEPLG